MELVWSNDIYEMFDEEDIGEEPDYGLLFEIIDKDFDNLFPENEHSYAARGIGRRNYYGLDNGTNYGKITDFFPNIKGVKDWMLRGCDVVRIHVGRYNHLIMSGFHHDGVEIVEIIRLNSKGQERAQRYYDEHEMLKDSKNVNAYISVGVWKDFKE